MRALLVIAALALVGCTEQHRARNFGGKSTVKLDPGRKLVNVTWKGEGALWLLTREARPAEAPETWHFDENSGWGFLEGCVVIEERAR